MPITVSSIYVYPIKSLGAISLNKVQVEEEGLQYDRRWMLVDENGRFMTQRTLSVMAQLLPEISPQGLKVTHRIGGDALHVPYEAEGPMRTVKIWDDELEAQEVNEACNAWFSEKLNKPCALVQLPNNRQRMASKKYTEDDEVAVSFADGFPILIANEASLEDLAQKSGMALEMERFRPNIVVSGAQAWEENTWKELQINQLTLMGAKPCGRCKVTTLNPKTGEKTGNEPLKTLMKLRNWKDNGIFGENCYSLDDGEIKLGYLLTVVEKKENPVKTIG